MRKNFYITIATIIFSNSTIGADQTPKENAAAQTLNADAVQTSYFDLEAFPASMATNKDPVNPPQQEEFWSIAGEYKERMLPMPSPLLLPDLKAMEAAQEEFNSEKKLEKRKRNANDHATVAASRRARDIAEYGCAAQTPGGSVYTGYAEVAGQAHHEETLPGIVLDWENLSLNGKPIQNLSRVIVLHTPNKLVREYFVVPVSKTLFSDGRKPKRTIPAPIIPPRPGRSLFKNPTIPNQGKSNE